MFTLCNLLYNLSQREAVETPANKLRGSLVRSLFLNAHESKDLFPIKNLIISPWITFRKENGQVTQIFYY